MKIKHLVTSVKSAVLAAELEQKELKIRAETAENALVGYAEQATVVIQETPKNHWSAGS